MGKCIVFTVLFALAAAHNNGEAEVVNGTLAGNKVHMRMTVFNVERPKRQTGEVVYREAEVLLEEETNDQNGTLRVSRHRRQTKQVDLSDVFVEDGGFNEMRTFDSEKLPSEIDELMDHARAEAVETSANREMGPHIATVTQIAGPHGVPLATTEAPIVASETPIRGRRQIPNDEDVCKRVLLDGLYMVRSPICDSFVECKNNKNTLKDESVMQCDDGLMFARASNTIKDGKPYMAGECVEYVAEECNKLLQA